MAQGTADFEPEVPSVRINKAWRDSTISTMTMNKRQIGIAHIPCLLDDFFKYVGLHYFRGVKPVEVNFHFDYLDRAFFMVNTSALSARLRQRSARAFKKFVSTAIPQSSTNAFNLHSERAAALVLVAFDGLTRNR
jgi:hypothetical protein